MNKNVIALILILLSGLVFGGFIGDMLNSVPSLSWLSYGKELGLTTPFVLNLELLKLTFGLTLKINISGIIGMVIAFIIYKKIR